MYTTQKQFITNAHVKRVLCGIKIMLADAAYRGEIIA